MGRLDPWRPQGLGGGERGLTGRVPVVNGRLETDSLLLAITSIPQSTGGGVTPSDDRGRAVRHRRQRKSVPLQSGPPLARDGGGVAKVRIHLSPWNLGPVPFRFCTGTQAKG